MMRKFILLTTIL
nr:unnamed protein product [Callosobruchus chinensis]